MSGEREAYLFPEDEKVEPGADSAAPLPDSPEARAAESIGWGDVNPPEDGWRRITSSRLQISTFCAAIRNGAPLACGPVKAIRSARACLRANESALKKEPLAV
jgi:hypothetical protein